MSKVKTELVNRIVRPAIEGGSNWESVRPVLVRYGKKEIQWQIMGRAIWKATRTARRK